MSKLKKLQTTLSLWVVIFIASLALFLLASASSAENLRQVTHSSLRHIAGAYPADSVTSQDDASKLAGISKCYCPTIPNASISALKLDRESPWALPKKTLGQTAPINVHILALRFSFPFENPDDPNTTGRGSMNYGTVAEFCEEFGHIIDPAPHDSLYFDQHLNALSIYYNFISKGLINLTWDIWPPGDTATYQAPQNLAFYGDPDLVEERLTQFVVDCINTADSLSPAIDFGAYQSVILFHAGADRQNDIDNPPTPNDMFTGFVRLDSAIVVDSVSPVSFNTVPMAMIMPEQASQDNRSVALNAVLAHEFGHQLGLVDLYSTRTGFTQLGDFALMDNNGFGVALEFIIEDTICIPRARLTFGALPTYMSAWSRAFLGIDAVLELERGIPLALAAAALDTNAARIARVPISGQEYFLIENRQTNVDGFTSAVKADPITGVLIGFARQDFDTTLTGDYDFILEGTSLFGGGIVIYHVDESVASGDEDGDGILNFRDNDLQWDPRHRFISIVEANGFVDLGGDFFKGFGDQGDIWIPTGFNRITPNTNPSTHSNTGANSHISIDIIETDTITNHTIGVVANYDMRVDSFPVWAGLGSIELDPIAVELDSFPGEELIVAIGRNLVVIDPYGDPGWNFPSPVFKNLVAFEDTVEFFLGEDSSLIPDTIIRKINLFAKLPDVITAGPIIGSFNDTIFVAVGCRDAVFAYGIFDSNPFAVDPRPDSLWKLPCDGKINHLMFNNAIVATTEAGSLYRFDSLYDQTGTRVSVPTPVHGICAPGSATVILSSDAGGSDFCYIRNGQLTPFSDDTKYDLGPVALDLDRDGMVEIMAVSTAGEVIAISIDTLTFPPNATVLARTNTDKTATAGLSIADYDLDGYPDVFFPAEGALVGLNYKLSFLDDFFIEFDDRFPQAISNSPALAIDLNGNSNPEMLTYTQTDSPRSGNIYAASRETVFGFPLPAGGATRGAPVLRYDTVGAQLSYLGTDGFVYAWRVDNAKSANLWRMGSADAQASNFFDVTALDSPQSSTDKIVAGSFYGYPNPALGSIVRLRYELGRSANNVALTVFDMKGQIIDEMAGSALGGPDNEISWNCNGVTPGVYRVTLKASYDDGDETAFTDIAVIR